MCLHKLNDKTCNHKNLELCPICDKVFCKDCGKEWGEKEYIPCPYPYTPYVPSPYPSIPYVTWCYSDSVSGLPAQIHYSNSGDIWIE